jgi:hypothetical protein
VIRPERLQYAGEGPAAFEPNHSVSYQKLSAVTFANVIGHLVGVGLDPP